VPPPKSGTRFSRRLLVGGPAGRRRYRRFPAPLPAIAVASESVGAGEKYTEARRALAGPDKDDYASLVDRIETGYSELGHQFGWRFLYTPARTLAPETRLAMVALNPGGSKYHRPAPSVENGNAYRVERWGAEGGPKRLQVQVRLLFEALADALKRPSATQLMDESLTANFCPFRAPSWEKLHNPVASIEFSKDLWSRTLKLVAPSVIVCLGHQPAEYVGAIFEEQGSHLTGEPEVAPVGWGSITYRLERYESSHARTLVVGLPHLSRFAIFGRPDSERAVDQLMSAVVASM
jgi:hypothetical protein